MDMLAGRTYRPNPLIGGKIAQRWNTMIFSDLSYQYCGCLHGLGEHLRVKSWIVKNVLRLCFNIFALLE
jgi:hypothetical protein